MTNKRYNLNDLDFYYPHHSINLSGFDIPLYIHISKIKFETNSELPISIHKGVYEFQYTKLKEINNNKWYLKFIDTESKIYNNFTENFLEYNNLENVYELLDIFDELDFNEYMEHLNIIINFMVEEYIFRLHNMLKIDMEVPKIRLKDKNPMPENLKEYLTYTSGYIVSQMGLEFQPTIYFPENIGKSVIEWSFRELELHMAYLTIKSRFESTEDRWQAKVSEDMMDSK